MIQNQFTYNNILVIGGGNIGTQIACQCASKGLSVTILSSKPEAYDGTLEIINEHNEKTCGKIKLITNSLRDAIKDQEIIFVTYPSFKFEQLADDILPYIRPGIIICVMPGTGGAEFSFRKCIKVGAILCGLQRVPSVARLIQYGKSVKCEGLRKELFLASIPHFASDNVALFLSQLWNIPCHVLPNYLNVTLTPSNPILHTARLKTMFSDYIPGKTYCRNPLFYGEWTMEASELLIKQDYELQNICSKLKKLDLSYVRSLKLHYESNTSLDMTNKLKSIKSLNHLYSPLKQISNNCWIPDFESRYFTADFPYGLAIIEELAKVVDLETPNISETMNWFKKITNYDNYFNLSYYGINNITDVYDTYLKFYS
jgi:opine dehydrogenase